MKIIKELHSLLWLIKKYKPDNQRMRIRDLLINFRNYLKYNYFIIFKNLNFFSEVF